MSENRFEMGKLDKRGLRGAFEGTRVITDTETGVQYLFAYFGEAGGVTLLVDKDGKPMIDKNHRTTREVDMRTN